MGHSAWLKLQRAEEHFKSLREDVERFENLKGNRVVVQGSPYDNRRPVVLRLRTEPPLEKWGLIIGDCVHNARSALDHALWSLTGQEVDTKDTKTQFPIFDDPDKFRNNGRAMLQRVPRDRFGRELAVIKWAQPYRRRQPGRDALQVLHSLDIADKHKLLGVGAVVPYHFRLTTRIGKHTTLHAPVQFVARRTPKFQDGTQLGVLSCSNVSASQGEPEVDMEGLLNVNLVFLSGVQREYRGAEILPCA